ncbi:hypothetical protein DOZ80_05675 [Pseudomonas fluorescens]|uniref:Uncharacterized protein n=1 Tax=Pseudomonas fluorescens TaxID=294 RepID=A0A327N8I1_PSEFL|nr:hypothetical protein DOZ80_05675 [Pseudomonas fluorescens]
MVVNDNAYELNKRGALEAIASKPAPTVSRDCVKNHKKGRCKRSGQGKTLDQELQINVSEHGAMNRIFDSSEIFHHGAGRYIVRCGGLPWQPGKNKPLVLQEKYQFRTCTVAARATVSNRALVVWMMPPCQSSFRGTPRIPPWCAYRPRRAAVG